MRRLAIAVVGLLALDAGAMPGPGPGEPFGGDDAGCVPATVAALGCSEAVGKALGTLVRSVIKCHARQAGARYREVALGQASRFDEEACEASARARFEGILGALTAGGSCAGSATLSAISALEAVLLAGSMNSESLDAWNGDVYCDPTSGVAIDETGDDAGTVPATKAVLHCSDRVAKSASKLVRSALRCHERVADSGFRLSAPPFDEEACEAAALAKFDAQSARLIAKGCPPCLDAAMQHALGVGWLARLDADNASIYPCRDDVLHVGTPLLDRPTLMALGIQLPIAGDDDHDASVSVRYRVVGAVTWRDGLPLFRVRPEAVVGRIVPQQFAGSLLDLRPDTTYEIELRAIDLDGPVDQTLSLTATTRAVPGDPAAPHPVAVSDAAGLSAALASAAAGDVITLADGVYAGPFELDASGTPANPIVVRGASTDGTILDGGNCSSCNVFEVYGSHVHVERLTLRRANRALRFQTAGAVGNVARRLRTQDTRLGFGARENQQDFYLCDNVLEGRLVWPHVYFDDGGAHSDDDGILVEGDGHVVCHNQLVGFGDALKNVQAGARALDFYGNEVLSAYDNGIELDYTEGNARCLRNRFTNTFVTLSYQPTFGGPSYTVRNVVVNVAYEQLKMQGVGGGTGPNGVLIYHNTFVSPAIALLLDDSVASHHFAVGNNLFVGPAMLAGTRVVDWGGAIDDGRFDYDGYFPDGGFRFNVPPSGLVSYANFAAMQGAGIFEPHGALLAEPIFANGLAAPASYATTLPPQDVTLAAASNAIDRGQAVPGMNDGFTGAAPDPGALERGCPLPIFGVRPAGVDESNEPLGCAP